MEPIWFKSYPKSVPRDIDVSQFKSVDHAIQESCKRYATQAALTYCVADVEKTYTFAELNVAVDQFAGFLQAKLGMQKGDQLAIMLPNSPQFVIAFLAAARLGIVCVNTNPLYTPREMEHQFSDSGVRAIIILDTLVDKLASILEKTHIRHVVVTKLEDCLPEPPVAMPVHSLKNAVSFRDAMEQGAQVDLVETSFLLTDVCVLQYTGGTTGVSKGAVLTQQNILANMLQIRAATTGFVVEGQEVVITAIPLYHIFALSVNFLAFLATGQHIVVVPQPIPIKNTVDIFKRFQITVITGVNTLFNALNNDSEFKKLAPKQIKFALAGGMALQESVADAWKAITGNTIIQGFGLTETSPVTHINPLTGNTPGSIGIPVPSTLAKIVDEQGQEVPLGEVGELLVRGPQVMQGYWKRPDETANVMKDGWLCTGDIARCDERGFFYIVDRKKDMILVSGFNVYPTEIEAVLATHPKVLEAAVIGVSDRNFGEAVKAFVVAKDPTLSIDELRKLCREQLTSYKRPRQFEIRSALPKSTVGKILRKDLRQEELAKKTLEK